MEQEDFNDAVKVIRDLLQKMDDGQKREIAYTVKSQTSWDSGMHVALVTEDHVRRAVRKELNLCEDPSPELVKIVTNSARWKNLGKTLDSYADNVIKDTVQALKP